MEQESTKVSPEWANRIQSEMTQAISHAGSSMDVIQLRKFWLRSKTVLLNLLVALLSMLAIMADAVQAHLGELQAVLPAPHAAKLTLALAVINIVLRLVASCGVYFRRSYSLPPGERQP